MLFQSEAHWKCDLLHHSLQLFIFIFVCVMTTLHVLASMHPFKMNFYKWIVYACSKFLPERVHCPKPWGQLSEWQPRPPWAAIPWLVLELWEDWRETSSQEADEPQTWALKPWVMMEQWQLTVETSERTGRTAILRGEDRILWNTSTCVGRRFPGHNGLFCWLLAPSTILWNEWRDDEF